MATAKIARSGDVKMDDADYADTMRRERALERGKREQEAQSEDGEEGLDMKSRALDKLLKTSGVFVAIMADKMKQQQKENAERARKAKTREDNLEAKAKAGPQEARKSTRTAVKTEDTNGTIKEEEPSEDADKENGPEPSKRGRGRPSRSAPKMKKEGSNILDYMKDKKELKQENGPSVQEALASAADDIEAKGEGLGAQDLTATEQPGLITGGKMRTYQLEGLEWLKTLWMNGLCGILADEMGLGKTIQAISLIAFFIENKIPGPFLIAAPLSTLRNWTEEFKRWAPDIPTVLYHGTPDERAQMRSKQMKLANQSKAGFPVVVTSYEICMNDKKFLGNYKWRYIVVDEGHRLKNMNCKLIKELMTYKSAGRLLITGTPLQNNIAELWSLLHFLLPEVFNDLDSFERWFDFSSVLQDKSEDGEGAGMKRKNNLVSTMHAILKPFLLRRIKTDVETSLPPKREYILYAPLTNEQSELLKEIIAGTARSYLEDKAVERIEARSRTASVQPPSDLRLKRKAAGLDSGRSTPAKAQKNSRAATPASVRASTPGSVVSTTSARGGRRKTRKNYEEIGDADFNKRLKSIEMGDSDVDINGNSPSPSSEDIDFSAEEAEHQRAATLKLAKQEIQGKKLQNPIMQARLACNSPHNFYWPFADPVDPENEDSADDTDPLPPVDESLIHASGKLLLLDSLLPTLLSNNHKTLIFSQFKTTLDILSSYLDFRSHAYCRIDGSIAQEDRYEQITSFNNPKSSDKVFLLSTRAGGQGINLTAADTVILFDSDWNPQQDLQAMDRAHRIGQKKPVIVYRFATRGTVEEVLLGKADGKRRLEKLVIQKGKFKSLIDGVDSKSGKLKKGEFAADDFRSVMGGLDREQGDKKEFEFERFVVSEERLKEQGGSLLSEEELKTLTDRSPEAYERAKRGGEGSSHMPGAERDRDAGSGMGMGMAWKVAETKADGLEELTTRDATRHEGGD